MIANARMYSVNPAAAGCWRALLEAVIERSGEAVTIVDHDPPAPIEALWERADLAAVFMCGLPYARASAPPALLAAPVPAGADFAARAEYWSELVVRRDSAFQDLEDTLGTRLALTTPGSQSGCAAALQCLQARASDTPAFRQFPLYQEIIAPQLTPVGAASAVADGRADVAPIDSYAFALLQRYRPDLTERLRVVARTARTPIPPLVASPPSRGRLQQVLLEAHRVPEWRPLLAALSLLRFERPEPAAYAALRRAWEDTSAYWREHRLAAKIDPGFTVYSAPWVP